MSKEKGIESPFVSELESLMELIGKDEWFAFVKIIKKHKEWLNGQILTYTKQGKTREADRAQAKYEDAEMIFTLIRNRIVELQKGGHKQ